MFLTRKHFFLARLSALAVTSLAKLGEKISRRMFSRMCDRGSAYGCYWIAARLLSGLGLPMPFG